jgi:protein-S-isoprenylcysteine O-methyltransferase Ste14
MTRTSMNTLSVSGYVLMVAGLLLLYFNYGLFSFSPVVIALQATAILLMVWARITFKARSFHLSATPTEGGLVTTGPYKFIRHPIYASVLLFVWSGAVGNWSVKNALLGCLVFAGAFMRIVCEESLVRARYPEYQQYAEKTKRLIPYVF